MSEWISIESLEARIKALEDIVIAYSKMLEPCAVRQAFSLEEQVRTAIHEARCFNKPESPKS